MNTLSIIGACEGNLRDITLDIPKNKLTVFTGVSGSGKSTLLVDVLAVECQRLHLEALSMQGIPKPAVDSVRGASPAIAILQSNVNRNPRSTVGTLTDLYTALRMVFEKLHMRTCPHCGATICAAECREETERIGDDFHVYQFCSACGERMDKLTRTDFSFNTREGACPTCEGLGRTLAVDKAAAVDESLSLEDGAVAFWVHKYREYQIGVFYTACRHFGLAVPENVPVQDFGTLQKALLYEGAESAAIARAFPSMKPPKTVGAGRFEGVVPLLMRRLSEQGPDASATRAYFAQELCPDCKGERLCAQSRSVTVADTRLPQLAAVSLRGLAAWVQRTKDNLHDMSRDMVKDYLLDLDTKLARIAGVGLDYLTLDRTVVTLSGGELQRLRLSAILDSDLSGMIYILDEPTAGLHPKDTAGLVHILRNLRDLGNTVLVIEHDPDVMRAADYLVDMGPGAGKEGGRIVAEGTLADLEAVPDSATGRFLKMPLSLKAEVRTAQTMPIEAHIERNAPPQTRARQDASSEVHAPKNTSLEVNNACAYNLQHLNVSFPLGCLTTVTGPSGSGKSTLVFEVLAQGNASDHQNAVAGCEHFDRIVEAGQAPVARMKRSNVATFLDVYTDIRNAFACTDVAQALGLAAKAFSFNTPGGRCETCEGMGTVENNLLFFTNTNIPCPTCHGRRFHDDVLSVKLGGLSIVDVLALSVDEAASAFATHSKIMRTCTLLQEVGLGYLELGQTLTTLSGGEAQRLKLAKELLGASRKKTLYLLDEPTSGLHPQDVENFLKLLNRLVDEGNTVVVVEHNQQVICASDWIIDLGPEGGELGGTLMFVGTPTDLVRVGMGATSDCLREELVRSAG